MKVYDTQEAAIRAARDESGCAGRVDVFGPPPHGHAFCEGEVLCTPLTPCTSFDDNSTVYHASAVPVGQENWACTACGKSSIEARA